MQYVYKHAYAVSVGNFSLTFLLFKRKRKFNFIIFKSNSNFETLSQLTSKALKT